MSEHVQSPSYIVQSCNSHAVFECPKFEACFWALINENFFHTFHFNIYKQGGPMHTMTLLEIWYEV